MNCFLLSLLLSKKITIEEHDKIAAWLELAEYRLPNDRVISPILWTAPCFKITSKVGAIQASMIAYVAEVHYSELEQIEATKMSIDKLPKNP